MIFDVNRVIEVVVEVTVEAGGDVVAAGMMMVAG